MNEHLSLLSTSLSSLVRLDENRRSELRDFRAQWAKVVSAEDPKQAAIDVEAEQAAASRSKSLAGTRVLLYGFSGAGFPGGDGVAEAVRILPNFGLEVTYTHLRDEHLEQKLRSDYDVAIITNTRVNELLQAPARLWKAAPMRVLWFWDLRPGAVGAALRGRVDRVFLSYNGSWTSPEGDEYTPEQWSKELDCPVGYCPQASPLRSPRPEPTGPRIVFVGDTANATYHRGRAELCNALRAQVVNSRSRDGRLAIESRMPSLYPSARYCLSTSPLAPGYTSVRTYSILACGGLLLLQRFPGCEQLFKNGEHALMFDTAGEAVDLLAQFDNMKEQREQIAAAGRALHASKHTVSHRVLSMLREIAGASKGFAGWL